jgi:hypothetical protein
MARITGVTDRQAGLQVKIAYFFTRRMLLALPGYRTSELFSDVDKLVLDYATGMSTTPVDVPDDLFARLFAHFDDGQLVELTHLIALENLRGRFNLALGVGAAGYSDGLVCAVPADARSADAKQSGAAQSGAAQPGAAQPGS